MDIRLSVSEELLLVRCKLKLYGTEELKGQPERTGVTGISKLDRFEYS